MSQATVSEAPRVGDRIADMPARHRDRLRLLRPILMLGGIAVVVVGSLTFWITGGRYVSIDNAYVRAAKEALSTDVSGIVMEVPVREGQHVKKGDVLLRLDDVQLKAQLTIVLKQLAQMDARADRLRAERDKDEEDAIQVGFPERPGIQCQPGSIDGRHGPTLAGMSRQ